MRRGIIWTAFIFMLGAGLALAPAEATLVTIGIEGTVHAVHDPQSYLEGLVVVGDLITGTYTYDTDTPNTSSSPQVGRYEHYTYPCGFSLSAGGLHFMTDPDRTHCLIQIVDDQLYSIGTYSVTSYGNLPLSNGAVIDRISWGLRDDSGSAVSSTELLATAPVLTHWRDFNYLNVEGPGSRDNILFQAHITSAYVIPEPMGILLLGLGGLLLRRRN